MLEWIDATWQAFLASPKAMLFVGLAFGFYLGVMVMIGLARIYSQALSPLPHCREREDCDA